MVTFASTSRSDLEVVSDGAVVRPITSETMTKNKTITESIFVQSTGASTLPSSCTNKPLLQLTAPQAMTFQNVKEMKTI